MSWVITAPYVDANGVELLPLDIVTVGDTRATIMGFNDPDGDMDDEGRPIGIPASITVTYDADGDEREDFSGHNLARWWDDDTIWQFEDIVFDERVQDHSWRADVRGRRADGSWDRVELAVYGVNDPEGVRKRALAQQTDFVDCVYVASIRILSSTQAH